MQRRIAIPLLMVVVIAALLTLLDLRGTWHPREMLTSVVVDDEFGNEWPDDEDVAAGEMSIYYQFNSFDTENQIANVSAYPWPVNELGTPYFSSAITKVPIRVFVDTIGIDGLFTYSVGEAVPGIPAQIDAYNPLYLSRASDAWYPFDQFSFAIETKIEADLKPDGTLNYQPIPIADYFYTTEVPGFRVQFTRTAHPEGDPENFQGDRKSVQEYRDNGQSVVTAKVQRNIAVQFIALVLSFFLYLIGGTLFWASLQVRAGKREANAVTLVWAATTVLAIIQFRSLLPGRPRLGVLLDYVVFFPTLTVTLVAIPILAWSWLKSDEKTDSTQLALE
jgi:hypothetical protein